MFTKLRQMICSHQFDIREVRRVPTGVEATCAKCAGVYKAPYGIALPGRLTWTPTTTTQRKPS